MIRGCKREERPVATKEVRMQVIIVRHIGNSPTLQASSRRYDAGLSSLLPFCAHKLVTSGKRFNTAVGSARSACLPACPTSPLGYLGRRAAPTPRKIEDSPRRSNLGGGLPLQIRRYSYSQRRAREARNRHSWRRILMCDYFLDGGRSYERSGRMAKVKEASNQEQGRPRSALYFSLD